MAHPVPLPPVPQQITKWRPLDVSPSHRLSVARSRSRHHYLAGNCIAYPMTAIPAGRGTDQKLEVPFLASCGHSLATFSATESRSDSNKSAYTSSVIAAEA